MNVNPGELDKRISIIERTAEEDADGYDAEPAEKTIHTCWAKFSRTSGVELAKANADFAEVKTRFLIRYTKKEINRKMIVRYAGNDYEIVYLNDYGDSHEYMEIWCRRLTLEG